MAAVSPPQAEVVGRDSPTTDELTKRNDWFTTTPDPWREIVRLEFGGDRTPASTVNGIVVNAEPAQRPAIEAQLLAVLGRPGLTAAARLFVCRMLGLIGTAACVPVVAPLMNDPRTADVARLALDGIADPAVNAAYRAALRRLTGAPLIGLIGSIAMRGDVQAVEVLTALAVDANEPGDVRTAAAAAAKRLGARS